MEAWLNCENLLISITQKPTSYSQYTLRAINECADICLAAQEALKIKYKNIGELALLCIGTCEECADICERYSGTQFKTCATTCRYCSNVFTSLALNA